MANNNQTPLADQTVDPSITTRPSNARITPTPENPRGYPPFDIRLVSSYTNNQLRHYHISGAMFNVDKTEFRNQMGERKTTLELINWDGDTRENTPTGPDSPLPPPPLSTSRTLSFDVDSEADSECPTLIPGDKGIKFNPSDVTQLRYDSNIAQFNNWLEDLKSAFDGDPAKYPTGRKKVIFASMTIDEQLKTTYNSIVKAHPAISTHWRKYKRWICDVVLHGNSDRLKLSNEFTTARQRVREDPNQFYLRLFNLGIQSGRAVETDDYRTRLVRPLQNLLNQHDRTYPTIQDAVAHAGRLWQTLDPDRVQQEIKEDREKRNRQTNHPDRQPQLDHQRQLGRRQSSRQSSGQSNWDKDRGSLPQSTRGLDRRNDRQDSNRLSTEERQYRNEKNLCFNCGYPGHRKKDCTYRFNPSRVTLHDNNQTQTQPPQGQKRPYVKAQPTRAHDESDPDEVHTTDESDIDEPERRKRSKN